MMNSGSLGGRILTDDELLRARKLLRPDEVARVLRVSRRQVYNLVDEGKLRSNRASGCIRIYTDSLIELLDE